MVRAVDFLDELDVKILRVLQVDASLSLQDLSDRVGLSHTPCWRRIKKMEDRKVIRGRVALIDQDALQLGVTVLTTVRLKTYCADSTRGFEQLLARRPEIMDFFSISGADDYLLKIVARSVQAYERFLTDHILGLPIVESARSMVALKQLKSTTALPI